MQPEVSGASPADRERVIQTVVAAFRADPAFQFFFPDAATFDEQAAAFAGYLFDARVARQTVWVVAGGASVSMWDAPATLEPARPAPALPVATLARLDTYAAAVHDALPTTPHWYLGVVATHPDHAGQRWGRAVIAAGLDRAANAGLPAYLETCNPRNVELYRRSGWTLAQRVSAAGLAVWIMTHPPREAAGPPSPNPSAITV